MGILQGMDQNELLGITEVAEVLGIHRDTLAEWRRRPGFPIPDVQLGTSPGWRRSRIVAWARGNGKLSAAA